MEEHLSHNVGKEKENVLKIFLSGDVMPGRGIDQVLPHPSNPMIHEPSVKSAKEYVSLAHHVSGAFSYPVSFSYIWGDALQVWNHFSPDLRIINLETSITTSEDFWEGKSVHYRMHPQNVSIFKAARIDFCSLANNHTLDWNDSGLIETLETLKRSNLKTAGAGRNIHEAGTPAVFHVKGKKVNVFSYGSESSGIPGEWAATEARPGVNLLQDLSEKTSESIQRKIQASASPEDFTIVSIHWGTNWGFEIPEAQIRFAHALIDQAMVDLVHGHSSHHVKGIEVYKGKLLLYGCGDFLNDYEGIEGYEKFRGDLSLMYFATVNSSNGNLVELQMVPTKMHRFRVSRASKEDINWLKETLNREGKPFKTSVYSKVENDSLFLQWVE